MNRICIGIVIWSLGITSAHGQSSLTAKSILQKALASYSEVKSYDALWSFTSERAGATQKMRIEVKTAIGNRLYFKIISDGAKPKDARTLAVPELLVVLDGKTAFFENTSEKVYYKVAFPEGASVSAMTFFPFIPAVADVARMADVKDGEHTNLVLQAPTRDGGTTRMEIDSENYRIRRITSEIVVAFAKSVSILKIERESIDKSIPDFIFNFKPSRGSKEMAPPLEAASIFGISRK